MISGCLVLMHFLTTVYLFLLLNRFRVVGLMSWCESCISCRCRITACNLFCLSLFCSLFLYRVCVLSCMGLVVWIKLIWFEWLTDIWNILELQHPCNIHTMAINITTYYTAHILIHSNSLLFTNQIYLPCIVCKFGRQDRCSNVSDEKNVSEMLPNDSDFRNQWRKRSTLLSGYTRGDSNNVILSAMMLHLPSCGGQFGFYGVTSTNKLLCVKFHQSKFPVCN